MKEAFEKMTGMPDAWTNPALMVSRNAFIQGWEAALAQPAQEPLQGPVFNKLLAYVCNVPDDGIYAGELYQERHSLIDEAIAALAAQPAPAQRMVANMTVEDGRISFAARILADGTYDLYTTPPAQPAQEPDHSDDLTIAYMSGVHRGKELAAQPAQEPLTDDARGFLVIEHLGPNALLHKPMSIYDAFHIGIDAAEAAHGIKETTE